MVAANAPFLSPRRGWRSSRTLDPRLTPWATVFRPSGPVGARSTQVGGDGRLGLTPAPTRGAPTRRIQQKSSPAGIFVPIHLASGRQRADISTGVLSRGGNNTPLSTMWYWMLQKVRSLEGGLRDAAKSAAVGIARGPFALRSRRGSCFTARRDLADAPGSRCQHAGSAEAHQLAAGNSTPKGATATNGRGRPRYLRKIR
jgi:hypothetical protein